MLGGTSEEDAAVEAADAAGAGGRMPAATPIHTMDASIERAALSAMFHSFRCSSRWGCREGACVREFYINLRLYRN